MRLKDFLKEEVHNLPVLVDNYVTTNNLDGDEADYIIGRLEKENGHIHSVEVDKENITFYCNLTSIDEAHIDEISEKNSNELEYLIDIINGDNEDSRQSRRSPKVSIDIGMRHLLFYGLPTTHVRYPEIYISFEKAKGTLHNVHKLVDGCDLLVIEHCENVTGNVLGLCRIRSKPDIDLSWPKGIENPEWAMIGNDVIHQGDVIDFQEALLDAGLEEYAQL